MNPSSWIRFRARTGILIGCAALVGGVPTVASGAQYTFTFEGRGWGHGVGLSQYGARGAALAGWDEQRILSHYYRNTAIEEQAPQRVRVLLRSTSRSVLIRGPFLARGAGTDLRVPAGRVRASVEGRNVVLRAQDGREIARTPGPIILRKAGGVRVRNGRYRGRVRLAASRPGVLEVVNIVGLEQYLRGVVPGEVPAAWGDDAPAAVRAQAIAARTFALATRKKRGRFDLFSDVRSQVYRGIGIEDPRTDEAIKKTRGMVITYGGAPIVANFFSTSGGQTASASTIWEGVDQPYLVSVNDPFDRVSPFHRWQEPVQISGADLGAALGLGGSVTNLQILSTGRSPRVMRVEVETEGGARSVVSGPQIRTAAGLRSTWFTFTRQLSREA